MGEQKKKRGTTPAEKPLEHVEGEIVEGEFVEPVEAEATPVGSAGIDSGEMLALQKELEAQKAKAAEYFDGWQRERADFTNYKRRIERDQVQLQQSLTGSIVKKFLPVLDDMERALKAIPQNGETESWRNGVELIYRKLQGILEAEGVQRIPAENEMFDPTRHEAIAQDDSPEHESGQIIEVVQQGYMIGDRVLRPSLVRVAR